MDDPAPMVVRDMAQGDHSRKVSKNSEDWDLGILFSMYHKYSSSIYSKDFGGETRFVIPILSQIKELRNRRVHQVSKLIPFTAREAYKISDYCLSFFELMTCEVPQDYITDFTAYRRQALQMLFVEELQKE